MQLLNIRPSIVQLQLLVWVSVLFILFASLLPMDGFAQAATYAVISTLFYATIIYGNIRLLYPRLYEKGMYAWYVVAVILSVTAVCFLRGYITLLIYNRFFALKPESFTPKMLLNFISGGVLIFVMSLIFRIALAYFKLKQQTEEIMVQKSQAELNLLKSQVQPHFLFNTLNNIYYEAYKEAPGTAALIERLSDIMRYFVDESPKDDVAITTEVQFIENYIELEKIRIRHGVDVDFEKKFSADLRIPPMLLMTFVENIFKHGIDKASIENRVSIALLQQDNYLLFKTSNAVYQIEAGNHSHGFGIANLRQRLRMLYRENFELAINKTDSTFTATFKIPLV